MAGLGTRLSSELQEEEKVCSVIQIFTETEARPGQAKPGQHSCVWTVVCGAEQQHQTPDRALGKQSSTRGHHHINTRNTKYPHYNQSY